MDIQSGIYAKVIRRVLVQELEDCQIIISESPDKTAERCKTFQPYAMLIEVTPYSPWMLEERLALRDAVLKTNPDCKIVFLVDDAADKELANGVKKAKRDGLIDTFLFSSATESYLAAVMDSL